MMRNHLHGKGLVAATALLAWACSAPPSDRDLTASSDSVAACPLTITKNVYDGPGWWGTIRVRNDGAAPMSGIQVALDVPAGVVCDYAEAGWTYTQAGHTCTYAKASGSLAPRTSLTLHYSTNSQAFSSATNVRATSLQCGEAPPVTPPPTTGGAGGGAGGTPSGGTCAFAVTRNDYDGPAWWGTLTFRNDNAFAATGLAVAFDIPQGAACDYAEAGWTYAQSGTTCTYRKTSGALAAGASSTLLYSTNSQSFSSAANVRITAAECGGAGGGGSAAPPDAGAGGTGTGTGGTGTGTGGTGSGSTGTGTGGGVSPAAELFDDFSYASTADAAFTSRWRVRTGGGAPGVAGAQWLASNVSMIADPTNGANRVMRMKATTGGGGTSHAEVEATRNKFRFGTYATRMRFMDAPLTGARYFADKPVETFFTITPWVNNPETDPNYSEQDFEYMPNGGWGQGNTNTLWFTSWEMASLAAKVSSTVPTSHDGWRTLVLHVSAQAITYFVDGVSRATHEARYAPETDQFINFNIWFTEIGGQGDARTYAQDVDWVYFAKDQLLAPAVVDTRITALRASSAASRDTVP